MPRHDLLQGLRLLESGDWDGAHAIAQADTSVAGSWLHGIVHRSNLMRATRGTGTSVPAAPSLE